MNELLKYENELELTKEGMAFVKKLQKAKIEITKMEEQLKETFLTNMEEHDIVKFVSNDGTFKVTRVPATVSKTFDSKRFKEEHLELYNEYLKETTRKSYVKFS